MTEEVTEPLTRKDRAYKWLLGVGIVALFAVPITGYEIIHHSQAVGQHIVSNTNAQVHEIKGALTCELKAFDLVATELKTLGGTDGPFVIPKPCVIPK